MLAHAHTTESLADMGFSNKIETCTADTSPPCVLFNGSSFVSYMCLISHMACRSINIGATRTISRNPGFGPTTSYLLSVWSPAWCYCTLTRVQIGGKFSPCMREEESYIVRANTEYAAECGPDRNNPCEVEDAGYGTSLTLQCPRKCSATPRHLFLGIVGCCTLSTGEAGMTTKAQCAADDPFSTWTSAKCVQNTDFIVLRLALPPTRHTFSHVVQALLRRPIYGTVLHHDRGPLLLQWWRLVSCMSHVRVFGGVTLCQDEGQHPLL